MAVSLQGGVEGRKSSGLTVAIRCRLERANAELHNHTLPKADAHDMMPAWQQMLTSWATQPATWLLA